MRIITLKQQDEIKRFLDDMRNAAENNFKRDGFCSPVAIFLCEQKQLALPVGPFLENKNAASALLNKLIDKIRPLSFVFVTEAWMAKAITDAKNETATLDGWARQYKGTLVDRSGDEEKPNPGVKDVAMLQCSAVTRENFMLAADILRDSKRKPVLAAWEKMDNREAQGRFIFGVVPLAEKQ